MRSRGNPERYRRSSVRLPLVMIASARRSTKRPQIADTRERIADAGNAYQIVSMLQGVVQRGTGRRIAELGKPLAGKR